MTPRRAQPRPANHLAPIRRSVVVSWDQVATFRRFTDGFATWWPTFSHSIGGPRVARVVFECRPGGQIYEEHRDGTRLAWGSVSVIEAPRRIVFRWHAAYEPTDAQEVEVTFTPEASGTRVDLVSRNWEAMGDKARKSYNGSKLAWAGILAAYAGRFTMARAFMVAMSAAISATGGRGRFIRESRGHLPRASRVKKGD
jgi:uncharacterized protein YndB with AHSA1/START domain